MVYYINDELNKDWSIVVHLKPRGLHDMGEGQGEVCEVEPCPQKDLSDFSTTLTNWHCLGMMKMMNY